MNRSFFFCIAALFAGCAGQNTNNTATGTTTDSNAVVETEVMSPADTITNESTEVYANQRFRNVRVERLGGDAYRITGEGQIFEAAFGWVVEDGHNELAKGHEMTSAGAPEWGQFDFTVNVAKQRANSSLTLVLFETSAEDGRRVYELPVPLR